MGKYRGKAVFNFERTEVYHQLLFFHFMCQYQTLYHHPQHGYVIRCMQCDQIQLGFGFLLLNLTEGGFRSLHSYLSHCCSEPSENRHIRNRVLPTPYDGIQLMMSTEELEQFYHLLDSAESEMRAQAMLELFRKTERE